MEPPPTFGPKPNRTLTNWIAAAYDTQAASYDAAFRARQHSKFEALLRHPSLRPLLARRVLDLGCGTGLLHNFCSEVLEDAPPSFSGWIGVDISIEMLRIASAKGLPTVLGSSTELPFATESFDLVCAFTSLGLTTLLADELAEAARVLAPGGFLVLSLLPDAQTELLPALENLPVDLIAQIPCGQDEGYIFTSNRARLRRREEKGLG